MGGFLHPKNATLVEPPRRHPDFLNLQSVQLFAEWLAILYSANAALPSASASCPKIWRTWRVRDKLELFRTRRNATHNNEILSRLSKSLCDV